MRVKKLLFLVPMLVACGGIGTNGDTTKGYTPLQFFQKYGNQIVYVQSDKFDVQYLGKINKEDYTYHIYHTYELAKIMENNYYIYECSYSLKFREDKTYYVWEDLVTWQGYEGRNIYVD